MEKKELTFLPIEHRTTEQKYQDIENRNKKIEKELVNIMSSWANFKSELNKIQQKKKRKDMTVYSFCLGDIAICTILLLIMEWGK